MKRSVLGELFCIGFVGLIAMVGLLGQINAETGYESAVRRFTGETIDVRRVVGSSVAGTEFFAATTQRPDGTCINNTSSVIWIGTVSATLNGQAHTNIIQGFPVLSTGTFPLDGSMTGNAYFTCDTGVAACEVRCIDGKVAR